MKCFHNINITTPLFNNNFILPKYDQPGNIWKVWNYSAEKVLSTDMIDWWKSHGCIASTLLIFHAGAHSTLPIHIDINTNVDTWACNWSIGEPLWMEWYKSKFQGNVALSFGINNNPSYSAKIPYKGYTEDMLEANISKILMSSSSIVRIGIPHGGFNNTDKDGWMVSVRFKSNLTFFKAIEKFWSIK
jgi:hypothetical protein